MSKAVIVGRPINGITINGLEYLMDDEGAFKIFDDMDAAKKFLTENGFDEAGMEDLVFVESIGTCFRCGSPLFPSQIEGYTSQCFTCDEDFFRFEQEADYLRKAMSDVLQIPKSALFALEHEEQQP